MLYRLSGVFNCEKYVFEIVFEYVLVAFELNCCFKRLFMNYFYKTTLVLKFDLEIYFYLRDKIMIKY